MPLLPDFQPIDPVTWERKPYFDYFYDTIKCKYNINANVAISQLLQQV